MFSVICYDIPDDRRRTRVGNILEGFGTRVQKSVFECDLKKDHLALLQQKLTKVIREEDSIRYYHLCAACVPKIEVINGPPVTVAQLYFTV